METSVDLQVQTQQTGTVFYIAVPVDAPWGAPTAEQIKNGLQYDGSQAFSSPVQDSITSNTNVASIIERGKLRNYGFGFFPVTSISWNLDYPDMPILSLHFDQINLGNEKGFGVEATFVKDAIYMNEQRPDGMSTKHGIGAFRHYGGEKLVELITEQLQIETGSVDDPSKADDVFTFVDNVYLFVGASDHSNTFSDATSAMEWSTDGGSSWTAYDEQNPPEFPGDMTVLIRECGSSILPPGDVQTFEFTSTIRMQFEGNDYLSNSSHNYEYSVNDGPYVHMPFDEQVFFKPGDNVKVREEARGIFSAGQPRVFLF
ncbi:DUF4073 domain-containing protein [Paenibacillus sp. MER TA 81-3]|uniref:DUF4073 domain-containing protein n=1 Tax=Paenibacillus sp. MER TA 81-3 TaxID=2939573 RepID=UPI00203A6446|nr:DUF4073 domain-containing protein [Paenibacillus sp. MER TA 81-3]MCM3339708.1 DUF4073 domain-containing protein [Paenibacillus sp. MER TA 81-3]